MDKKRRIMSTSRKTSSNDYRGKTLKPSTRSLFEAIKRTTKTTNHTLRNRIPRRRLHIDLLTQLTIKKDILDIKLRDGLLTNRGHSKKSANSGHVSNRGKSFIIVTQVQRVKGKKETLRQIEKKPNSSLALIAC